MTETVKVTFDGVEYEVPKGRTVLETAKDLDIPIPYFCWHKHLSVSGNCRMCLVYISPGPPKPQIACGTYVADGMTIDTKSEKVRAQRQNVLEFLLLNHPLDCPVCDKAYECKLQNYTYNYGNDAGRFVDMHDQKRVYKRENLGKIFTEMNRCIHCTRCVRYLREVAGEPEMQRLERGHELKIGTWKEAFESDFALNAVDICPVGALGDRKFNFTTRVWNLQPTPSVCGSCSVGCNVTVESFEGVVIDEEKPEKIVRLRPRENPVVNATWMCDYGRHHFDWINQDRLRDIRVNGKAASADEAVKAIANNVEQIGKGSFALSLNSWLTTEELWLGKKLAALWEGSTLAFVPGYNKQTVFEDVTQDVLPVTLVSDDKSPNSELSLNSWLTTEELWLGKKLAALWEGSTLAFVPGYNKQTVFEDVTQDVLPVTLVSDDKSPNSEGGRLLGLPEGSQETPAILSLIDAMENGSVRGLVMVGDPCLSHPDLDRDRLLATVKKLSCFVYLGPNTNELSDLAHIVLPSAAYVEKRGSLINRLHRVQKLRPALRLIGDTDTELSWLSKLGAQFEDGFGFEDYKPALNALAEEEAAFSGLRYEALGLLGVKLVDGKAEDKADDLLKLEAKIKAQMLRHAARDSDKSSGHDA